MSSKMRKHKKEMEYFLIYHPETNSWFINKSKDPNVSARRQMHRAFHPERPDYDCPFYQDIRKYGEDAFLIRYCLELPDFCEGVRCKYIQHDEPNEEIYKQVLAMREERTPVIKPLTRKQKEEMAARRSNFGGMKNE